MSGAPSITLPVEHPTTIQRVLGTEGVLSYKQVGTLTSPEVLRETHPVPEITAKFVKTARQEIRRIIHGEDDRVLCVVGPCSIHDPTAALEYAEGLKKLREKYKEHLLVVMRVYFEKPRTTVGWKGLINDPELTGSFKINEGLRTGRKLLLDINKLGMPAAAEFLDVFSPQWLADLISWGAIGARTTQSQIHRELASGLPLPIGFKNTTAGSVQIAADAIRSSSQPHAFISVTAQGSLGLVHTNGNKDTHVVLRGGKESPNYDAKSVYSATTILKKDNANPRLMIDLSHSNSRKIHTNQLPVATDVAVQIANGNRNIVGLMCESNLVAGKQKFTPGKDDPTKLTYGQSITDACVDLLETDEILGVLSNAVKTRRALLKVDAPCALSPKVSGMVEA